MENIDFLIQLAKSPSYSKRKSDILQKQSSTIQDWYKKQNSREVRIALAPGKIFPDVTIVTTL